MRLPVPLWSIALAAAALVGVGLLLLRLLGREERLAERLRQVRSGSRRQVAPGPDHILPIRVLEAIGNALTRSGLLPARTLIELETVLAQGGMKGSNRLGVFVGTKAAGLVLCPVLAFFFLPQFFAPMVHNLMVAGSGVLGLLGPDWYIKRRRQNYLAALEKGLADALDMMVICSEAGLGLEPSIERVGKEIAHAHATVSEEFSTTAGELRVLSDRRQALLNLGARTGIDSLKRLGATLVQTLQYGTPLAIALRTLSAELRSESLTRFEARAARLPVLLTLPMIIFILPTLFLVVGAPAAIQAFASNQ